MEYHIINKILHPNQDFILVDTHCYLSQMTQSVNDASIGEKKVATGGGDTISNSKERGRNLNRESMVG